MKMLPPDLRLEQMAELVKPTAHPGHIQAEASRHTGLFEGTPCWRRPRTRPVEILGAGGTQKA